jgi:UDPglucose--hexose-1-phosphate uridylyltransferase
MPELRKDPIIDRWVIIAAERGRRPTDFSKSPEPQNGAFDPFAPGNEDRTPPEIAAWGRPEGAPANSPGWQVRVVPNKFPALASEGELNPQGLGMFDLVNGVGAHEIIIENPLPDWDFDKASVEEMRLVLNAYIHRINTMREDKRFRYAVVFRNAGAAAGATLSHPHSQIIAVPILPKLIKEPLEAAREYFERKQRCIYMDIVRQELAMRDRVVEESEHFVVLSPFAARFPFEVTIFPRRQCHDFTLITPEEIDALGEVLTRTLRRYQTALSGPAYNMMLQNAPFTRPHLGTIEQDFCWHIDILPRLTNVAGFEWGTGFYINPVSPEKATEYLREAG